MTTTYLKWQRYALGILFQMTNLDAIYLVWTVVIMIVLLMRRTYGFDDIVASILRGKKMNKIVVIFLHAPSCIEHV